MNKALTFDDVLLVPKKGIVKTRRDIKLNTKVSKLIELALPIISAPMDTVTNIEVCKILSNNGGLGILHRFQSVEDQMKDAQELQTFNYGVAIGLQDYNERIIATKAFNPLIYVLDVAHGHQEQVLETVKNIKKEHDIQLMVGNVATGEGTLALIKAGADAIKVGIGPGAVCTTRIVTGFGVPQLTALKNCISIAKELNVPICADGGIKNSGDIVKALALGASTVMIGKLIASTEEAPGEVINGMKGYRGMASNAANDDRLEKMKIKDEKYHQKIAAEGVEARIPCIGKLQDLLNNIKGGIRSGISYGGGRNIEELCKNAEFIQISHASFLESQPHDVVVTRI